MDHLDIEAYKKAMELIIAVYGVSSRFPVDERDGLLRQIRSSVTEIATNLAYGATMVDHGEFAHYVALAEGKVGETECGLAIARGLHYVDDEANATLASIIEDVRSSIRTLRVQLRRKSSRYSMF